MVLRSGERVVLYSCVYVNRNNFKVVNMVCIDLLIATLSGDFGAMIL